MLSFLFGITDGRIVFWFCSLARERIINATEPQYLLELQLIGITMRIMKASQPYILVKAKEVGDVI